MVKAVIHKAFTEEMLIEIGKMVVDFVLLDATLTILSLGNVDITKEQANEEIFKKIDRFRTKFPSQRSLADKLDKITRDRNRVTHSWAGYVGPYDAFIWFGARRDNGKAIPVDISFVKDLVARIGEANGEIIMQLEALGVAERRS